MNTKLKRIIAVILSVFLSWVIVYGSILPITKSKMYIKARQTQVSSLSDFDKTYGNVLGFISPVGQDEIVANYLDLIDGIIAQEKNKEKPAEALIRPLVASSSMWAEPIIEKGSSFGYSQIIYNYASVYRDAALALKDKNYYEKSLQLFKLGLKASPDRQIFLYNLFDLYTAVGDKENARIVGNRILEVYKDERVSEVLKNL